MAASGKQEWSALQRRRFHQQMSDAVEQLLNQGRPDGVTDLDQIEVEATLDVRVHGKFDLIICDITIGG